MIPWETIDRATIPGGGELTLVRRGDAWAIRMDGAELMASRAHASEERMAVLAAEVLGKSTPVRVFIGGLGLGYTLRATLDAFPAAKEIVVAELVPEVVRWVEGPLAHLAGRALDDPRVTVVTDDALEVMRRSERGFDALLVDIDNSPTTLVRAKNASLYSERGLAIAKRALAPGGVLVVWSGGPDARFLSRMRAARFDARELRVAEHGKSGRRYTLFVGETKAAPKPTGNANAKPFAKARRP